MSCRVPQAIALELVAWREEGALTWCYRIRRAGSAEEGERGSQIIHAQELWGERAEERFIARKRREAMEWRSSLRDPAHKRRAEEKAGSLRLIS